MSSTPSCPLSSRWSPTLAFAGALMPALLICGLSQVSFAALGSTMEHELGFSHFTLGLLQSAVFAGAIIGSMFFAGFVRHHPLQVLGAVAIGMLVLANALSCFPYLATLLPGRFCIGLASCGLMLLGSTLAMRAWPARQDAILNVVHGTVATGSCTSMFLTLPLVPLVGGWLHVPLVWLALLVVPAVLLAVSGRDSLPPPAAATAGGSAPPTGSIVARWWGLRHDHALWRTAPALGGYILAETAVIVFYPLYAQHRGAVTAAASANFVGLYIGGIVGGRWLLAWGLGTRYPGRLTVGLIVLGGAVLLVALWPALLAPLPAGVLLALGGALMGPVAPLTVSLAVRAAHGTREDILALTNILLCAGGLIGGAVVGWLSDLFGLGPALVASLALFILAALPLLALRRPPAGQ